MSPDEIVRREWAFIHRIIASSVRDRSEVDDLTQETFSRALRHLTVGTDDLRVRAYLVQTARNLLRDRWRRYQAAPTLQGIDEAPELAGPGPGPEDLVVQAGHAADERAALVVALSRLPAEMREILRLRLQEGRTSAEVAEVTGRSPAAVRQIAHRALVRLRAEYLATASEGPLGEGGAASGRGGVPSGTARPPVAGGMAATPGAGRGSPGSGGDGP